MKKLNNIKEIWQALIDGQKVRNHTWVNTDEYIYLKDNELYDEDDKVIESISFETSKKWETYEPLKEKKKYWLWIFKTKYGAHRGGNYYYDDNGIKTNGDMYADWDKIEKIKLEHTEIEV